MTDQKKPFLRPSVVIAVLLSWLGLAGLADAFVEWKAWFDIGIMTHWRGLQAWVLQWVPFYLPLWAFDYVMLGVIYARAFVVVEDYWAVKTLRETVEGIFEQNSDRGWSWAASLAAVATLVAVLVMFICWPALLAMDTWRSVSSHETKSLGQSLLCFGDRSLPSSHCCLS